jgi:hypothetical protein
MLELVFAQMVNLKVGHIEMKMVIKYISNINVLEWELPE